MPVEIGRDGGLARIRFDNPATLNALSPEERAELAGQFAALRHDDAVRAVLLAGAGTAFCSGADVGRMGENDLPAARTRMQRGVHPLVTNLSAIEKPVISAVRGVAAGIGWGMALASDFVIASENARFSFVFVKRGLVPDGGALYLLTRHIGTMRAKEIVYTGRTVPAAEALELGLVTRVVPDDELENATAELAASMAEGPTRALGFAKRLFANATGPGLEQYLELEALMQPQLNQSDDYREGVAAFREKRPPRFIGR
ncbi:MULTISPECIES: enoyl-CoA hydratase/isomerase family protein [Pseudonocardia]|uniref:1,2-epoxyphenylacetyl-CoA isomerase n=2 Tax=Pseudonocardia TaxID=1847 RepID=A0A1Y2MMY7_PSEAH|nr:MULTISPECIES: enoyl-CoA hydratase-related protein [Pseudonocardia]OSY35828.1 1,2-epoxyphenylacetyl-CoA isomerase [Pseudonocardia autotrophica]TDN73122.1 2-(1,2-epoxy-1,2-dihydrophenyl)acetyl-CoA isomerase [Pseudonocardia autotrophica]BBG03841.1 enoyl-CoA hydratase [Pseudonocardia autotrophica]GEC27360.1 enoyl-CoA hydratase [Pseudonocardia saturnea]